jgi:hypothetical protein
MDERTACAPVPLDPRGFNKQVVLPCGLTTTHVKKAMADFLDFLGFLNQQLYTRQLPRLESFLMPANHYGKRDPERLREDGSQLDLPLRIAGNRLRPVRRHRSQGP